MSARSNRFFRCRAGFVDAAASSAARRRAFARSRAACSNAKERRLFCLPTAGIVSGPLSIKELIED